MNSTLRQVLITGATGALGTHLAKAFAEQGWSVGAVGRSAERLRTLQTQLGSASEIYQADLTAEGAIGTLVGEMTAREFEPIALLNFARGLDYLKLLPDGSPATESWTRAFDLEVRVAYELSVACTNAPRSKLASVINASSMYGITTFNPNLYEDPNAQSPIQYAVVKAAVIHLTHELAVRLAPQGVRVNCISYGGVEGRVDDAFKARYSRLAPAGRMLEASDLAGPALFLASQESSGVTGHNLVVDGGWTIW